MSTRGGITGRVIGTKLGARWQKRGPVSSRGLKKGEPPLAERRLR